MTAAEATVNEFLSHQMVRAMVPNSFRVGTLCVSAGSSGFAIGLLAHNHDGGRTPLFLLLPLLLVPRRTGTCAMNYFTKPCSAPLTGARRKAEIQVWLKGSARWMIHHFPIVTKDQLRKAGRAAMCHLDSASVSHIQNTSGTTGEQFFVYRSTETISSTTFMHNLLTKLSVRPAASIMLQIQFPHPGLRQIPASSSGFYSVSVNDDQLMSAVLVLRRELDLQGVDDRVSIFLRVTDGHSCFDERYLLSRDQIAGATSQ